MGFQRKRKVYKLDFDGTEYDGLEVKVSGLTTGEYLDIIGLAATGTEGSGETDAMLKMFARHLISWNLEDDNIPVPSTYDGIKSNDLTMNLFIINAWTDAIGNVPKDTGKELPDGESSLVASIPMEILSASPVS